jgi:hypothetical protein
MYLITASADGVQGLRRALEPLGDSLMVTGDDHLWNVHVHVHDAGAAIEAGLAVGTLERIRVTYLAAATSPTSGRGLVVVTHGPGTAALVAEQGAVAVGARPRRRPSTAELLEGVRRAHAAEIVMLPSDSDSLAVAEAAAEQARGEGLRVSVIPARSIVQSLAALAVHDPGARFVDDVIAMTRAVVATRYAAVTIASKDALTSAGPCRAGDVLGLAEGDIVEIGSDVPFFVYDRTCDCRGRGEIVTPVVEADAPGSLPIFLIKPGFEVSAGWAYQQYASSSEYDGFVYATQSCSWGEMVNDLERPVFEKHIVLGEMKSWLLAQPEVSAALMSGSGSTMLAILKPGIDGSALETRALERYGENSWTFLGQTS